MSAIRDGLTKAVREAVDVATRLGHLGPLDPAKTEALVGGVVDAFERRDSAAGTQLLAERATGPRGAEAAAELLDSALAAMGSDLRTARRGWFSKLDGLRPSKPAEASPVRDAFRGIGVPLHSVTTDHARSLNAKQTRVQAAIERALESPAPLERVRAIEGSLDLEAVDDGSRMMLVEAYLELEAWSDLVRVFDHSPPAFAAYPIPRQRLALALTQLGAFEEASAALTELVERGQATGAALGLLGRIAKIRAGEEADPVAARALLDQAIGHYRAGFDLDRSELYPGINLPVLLVERGDADSVREARDVARVIGLVAELRAAEDPQDFWAPASALVSSLVRGDDIGASRWLAELNRRPSEAWQRRSLATDLRRLQRSLPARHRLAPTVAKSLAALGQPPAAPRADGAADPVGHAILRHAYRFEAEAPKWLSGNYAYDGIAHDVRVTEADFEFFTRAIERHGLAAIDDPIQVSRAIDAVVRQRFRTDEMEDPKSERHLTYDKLMAGLARFMGATRENSQTNVAADWINGFADCRQHAPVKLVLFEAWKDWKARALTGQLFDRIRAGDETAAASLEATLRRLSCFEMRILDAEIVDADTKGSLEEHTMNLLIEREPVAGMLVGVRVADSFYQSRYNLGDGLVAARMDAGGALELDGAFVDAEGKKVLLRPTVYSFDRSRRSTDFGQLKFRGVQVATPGWEREIPIDGVDLSKLHGFVLAPRAQLDGKGA